MAEQAGHWLPLGDPHAGPFTAGSEDPTLWPSLGTNKKDRDMGQFEDRQK